MPSLQQQQSMFVRNVAKLIQKAHELGYEPVFGDAYRDRRCNYGSKSSKHRIRMAVDLKLFNNGVYLTETGDHEELGKYWESLGGIWGGRFSDENHYEWPLAPFASEVQPDDRQSE